MSWSVSWNFSYAFWYGADTPKRLIPWCTCEYTPHPNVLYASTDRIGWPDGRTEAPCMYFAQGHAQQCNGHFLSSRRVRGFATTKTPTCWGYALIGSAVSKITQVVMNACQRGLFGRQPKYTAQNQRVLGKSYSIQHNGGVSSCQNAKDALQATFTLRARMVRETEMPLLPML